MTLLQTSNLPVEEDLQQRSPETPKLLTPNVDTLNRPQQQPQRAAQAPARCSPKKQAVAASRSAGIARKRSQRGPLIVEDDSKPLSFTDLTQFPVGCSSVVLRPPFSLF